MASSNEHRLLIQTRGSGGDPNYDTIPIRDGDEEINFLDFFHREGVRTLVDDLVISCHGNTSLTLRYAHDIQNMADNGYRIALTAAGGLLWALPSVLAANMPTVPVFSIPRKGGHVAGLDAVLSNQLPGGNAVVGGVGLDDYADQLVR